jgi:hypothetical protein
MRELKHELERAKALLLLHSAPDQSTTDYLKSKNGEIKCMFLSPNTSFLIEPMDQGGNSILQALIQAQTAG